jgi:tRNA G46 methylase TrmB
MKTQSSPVAVRTFRADRVPVPVEVATRLAALQLSQAIARGRPIDLEIGCGVGWHPIRYARENPNRTLVAIERTAEKFAKFRERLANHPELTNLIAVHADAVAWVTHFAPGAVFDRVFLLYPNPNPKNPAARWIRMPFFGRLLESLKPEGEIEIRTNLPDYADEVREYGPKCWPVVLNGERRLDPEKIRLADAATHFERKYLARGEPCYAIRMGLNAPEMLR